MSLRQKAFSGVKWTGSSAIVTSVAGFLETAALARILGPEAFGLMSMILVVMGFARAYADGGISNAIIYHQNTTREQLSSLYWLNILFGIGVFFLVVAATPLVVDFYNEPRLNDLLVWVALMFVISPFGQQFRVLLRKNLRFNAIARMEMLGAVVSLAVSVTTALLGAGVFALVWGHLAKVSVETTGFMIIGLTNWRPGLRFKISDLRGYVGFGLYQMGERTTNYFSGNVDYLLIGRFLGADVLGAYTLAYQLIKVPLVKINPILTRVAFPIFSRKQNDNAALRRGYLEISKILALVVFPMLVGLAAVAPVFVPAVFGDGWELAIPLIQLLALVGMLKTLGNPSGSITLAKGRADIGFKWNVFVALSNTFFFWVALQHSIYAMAAAYASVQIVYFFLDRQLIIRPLIGLRWSSYLRMLRTPTVMCFTMGAGVYGLFLLSQDLVINQYLLLGLLIGTGGVIYGGLTLLWEYTYLRKLYDILLGKQSLET